MAAVAPSPLSDVPAIVDRVYRRVAARTIAILTRLVGAEHLEIVEDAVQDALVSALRNWPLRGVPDDPAAWIFRAARNAAIDALRREQTIADREAIVRSLDDAPASAIDEHAASDPRTADAELRLIWLCCHPSLSAEQRVALTLKIACGFGVPEIARALVTPETTVQQQLVRAKRRLRERHASLELPELAALAERSDSVIDVIYLLYNEGHHAHAGEALLRAELCGEAIRLAELLVADPATATPKAHALAALLHFQTSRLETRLDGDGGIIRLRDQDRTRWNRAAIARGFAHLAQSATGADVTTIHLEAEIASHHAIAATYDATDWTAIVGAYDQLVQLDPSPVVALNRAVAIAELRGAQAGLAELDRLDTAPAMQRYFLYHATRGELLDRAGDRTQAQAAFRRALALTFVEPARRFVEGRLTET